MAAGQPLETSLELSKDIQLIKQPIIAHQLRFKLRHLLITHEVICPGRAANEVHRPAGTLRLAVEEQFICTIRDVEIVGNLGPCKTHDEGGGLQHSNPNSAAARRQACMAVACMYSSI